MNPLRRAASAWSVGTHQPVHPKSRLPGLAASRGRIAPPDGNGKVTARRQFVPANLSAFQKNNVLVGFQADVIHYPDRPKQEPHVPRELFPNTRDPF